MRVVSSSMRLSRSRCRCSGLMVLLLLASKWLSKVEVPWPLASSSDCRRLRAEELETALVSLPPKLSKLSGVAGVLSQDP